MKTHIRRRRSVAILATMVATLLAISGCSALSGGGEAPSQELTVAFSQEIIGLDPYGTTNAHQALHMVDRQVFDTLVVRDEATGEYVPSLAEEWSQPDPLTWEFSLRDAKFHDGTPVTADDVVADLEKLTSTTTPLSRLWTQLDYATALDDSTLQIVTKTPLGTMLANLALLYVAPAAAIDSPDFANHPIGSGPFQMESYTPGTGVTLTAYPDYWNGAPKLQKLSFIDIPDESARLTALRNGEVDIVWVVSPDQVGEVASDPGIRVENVDAYAYYFLWFNSAQAPFDDVRVRQAMWHAVDVESVISDLYGDAAGPMRSPLPSAVFGSSKETPYEYDPELAKKLLAEAGYPDGFSTSVILAQGSSPLILQQAQAYASYWAKIGVDVQVEALPQAVWLERLLALDWPMDLQENSVLTGDADYTLGRLYTSGANRNGYHNPKLDDILARAAASTDQADRAELYGQANKIIWDDAVGIFPASQRDTYAISSDVQGFAPSPNRFPLFSDVSIGATQ